MEMILGTSWFLFAVMIGVVASNKGKSLVLWFFLSILLSPLVAGFCLIITLMPNSAKPQQSGYTLKDKKCPFCAESIKIEAIRCRFCGHDFNPEEVEAKINERQENYYESMAISDLHLAALELYGRKDYDGFVKLRNIVSTKYPNSREYKLLLDYSVKGKNMPA